mgnify:CR=1 FL=1
MSGSQSKISRHAKKQECMTFNGENIEIELVDKDIRTAIIHILNAGEKGGGMHEHNERSGSYKKDPDQTSKDEKYSS